MLLLCHWGVAEWSVLHDRADIAALVTPVRGVGRFCGVPKLEVLDKAKMEALLHDDPGHFINYAVNDTRITLTYFDKVVADLRGVLVVDDIPLTPWGCCG